MIANGFNIKTIDDDSIEGKRVLLKVDFNVSLTDKLTIADDARIRQALPTIRYLLNQENKLILVSHFGRPNNRDPKFSLKIVADHLQKLLPNYKVKLALKLKLENSVTETLGNCSMHCSTSCTHAVAASRSGFLIWRLEIHVMYILYNKIR